MNLPPLPQQKAIAHILGKLDDKIELNRQMNQSLENMAQALFQSWFVDFDPVLDNALLAGHEIPEALQTKVAKRLKIKENQGLKRDDRFPDRLVYNEDLGKFIPEGWEVRSLYETAEFINGASFKASYFSEGEDTLPIIKIAELKNGISTQTKFTRQEMPDKYFITKGDLLYSWSGSPETSLNTFLWIGIDGWLNQHIFKVVTKDKYQKAFVSNLLKYLKPTLIRIAKDKQTTGLGHVTVKDMKNLKVVLPTTMFDTLMNNGILSLFEKGYSLMLQTETLTQVRDTLLPKLISGKLKVPAALLAVEKAIT